MVASLPPKIRRLIRVAALTGFMGLLLGYIVFATTYPNASVPSVGEANSLFTFASLFAGAILAGVLSDDILAGILQAFLALPVGAAVASFLSISPVFGGLIVTRPEDVIFFTLRSGFPLLFASVPIMIVSTVVGIILQEKLRLGPY